MDIDNVSNICHYQKNVSVNNYMVMAHFEHVSVSVGSIPTSGIAGQNVKGSDGENQIAV